MPLEIGNCSTVASRPMLPPICLPARFFELEFERRQFFAGEERIGDVVVVHNWFCALKVRLREFATFDEYEGQCAAVKCIGLSVVHLYGGWLRLFVAD